MEKQNCCKVRFLCVQPQKCKHAKQKISGGCEYDFVGECFNTEAKEEALKEFKK